MLFAVIFSWRRMKPWRKVSHRLLNNGWTLSIRIIWSCSVFHIVICLSVRHLFSSPPRLHMGTPKCCPTPDLKLAAAAAISVHCRHFRSPTRSVSVSAKEDGHAQADGNCQSRFCPLCFTVAVIKLQFLPGGTLVWNYQMSTTTWRHLCHCDTANLMMPLCPYNTGLWSDLFQCVWLHDFKMKHKLIWCCVQTLIYICTSNCCVFCILNQHSGPEYSLRPNQTTRLWLLCPCVQSSQLG